MPHTLIWTVVPAGFTPAGRARLSLVATPKLQSPTGRLDATPFLDWPRHVGQTLDGRDALGLRIAGTAVTLPVEVVSDPVDIALWRAVMRPDTTVALPPGKEDAVPFETLVASSPTARAAAAANDLYATAMRTSPGEALAPEHPVARAVSELSALTAALGGDAAARGAAALPDPVADLLDPARITTDRLDGAVEALQGARRLEAAAIAPLAAVVARHSLATAGRGTGAAAAGAPHGPAPLDAVGAIESCDVHQFLSLLVGHPAIGRRLRIVTDLEVDVDPALLGAPAVRVVRRLGGLPLEGTFDTVRSMWSRVVCQTAPARFVMAAAPAGGGADEMRDGVLDVGGDTLRYVVSDLDVDAIARQLDTLGAMDGAASAAGLVLPARQDVGLRLTQAGRAESTIAAALAAPAQYDGGGERIEGEAVLHADDVTAGYRVDVRRNTQPWRSLMQRVVRYTIEPASRAQEPIEVHDEGHVEPIVAVQTTNGFGQHLLAVSEDVAAWNGYGLGAPRPGPVVLADGRTGATVGTPDTGVLPGFPLRVAVETEPGSLPVLRYGDAYSLRVRAADLGGNSLAHDEPSIAEAAATAPTVFRRHVRVASPTLVPRRPFRDGETLLRLVVRSDHRGQPIDPTSERHLAAPSAAQELVERHGMLDAAFGPDSPARAAARRAMLALARRESGAFTDPVVPATDGSGPVPARGIRVVAPPGEAAATLPPPPGAGLPAGQYVVLDDDAPHLPYLADPAASGAALIPSPTARPVPMPYGGTWPAIPPGRLVLAAARPGAPVVTVTPGSTRGRGTLTVAVAPGREVTMELASTITPRAAAVMDQLPAGAPDSATSGKAILLSQRQAISFVHASQAPVADPGVTPGSVGRERGGTDAAIGALLTYDGPSTGTVDLVATWSDVVDPGHGPLVTTNGKAVLGQERIDDKTSAKRTVTVRHEFGDTLHRSLTVTPVAATRFRDCFPELAAGDPSTLRTGPSVAVSIPSSRPPEPPVLHSVLPIHRWERRTAGNRYVSTRHAGGVRLYLCRPWLTTGAGESLGVVVFTDDAASSAASLSNSLTTRFASRYGADKLVNSNITANRLTADDLEGGTGAHGFAPHGSTATLAGLTVVEHEVGFDAERDLWYCDVPIRDTIRRAHFVRLAIVRYQRAALADCRASRIVHTDWIPVDVTETLTVKRTGDTSVELLVSSPVFENTYVASLEPRLLPPPAGAPRGLPPMDITRRLAEHTIELKNLAVPVGDVTSLVAPPPDDSQGSTPTPPIPPFPVPPPPQFDIVAWGELSFDDGEADAPQVRTGRLVVCARRHGEDIRKPTALDPYRTTWIETVDWNALPPPAA